MRGRIMLFCCFCLLLACGRTPAPTATLSPTSAVAEAAATPQETVTTAAAATHTPLPTPTDTPDPTPAPSFTAAAGATAEPTAIPQATPTHEPPATATPRPIPTAVPLAANAISPANATHLVEQEHIGWGQVDRIRFSPDGQLLGIATTIGIFLHDANTNLRIREIPVASPIRAFNFSPDGQLMATGHDDRRVRLWRVSDGSLVRTLEGGHNSAVWSVAFSPDGTLLATTAAAEDGTINLWQVNGGTLLRQITGHASRVRDVVFSPDGQKLASASIDWTVRLWNVADGTQLQRLAGHQGAIWRLVFSADGQYLHTGGSFGELITWRVSDGAKLYQTQVHPDFIEIVALAAWPNANRIATAGEDGDIFIWDMDNGLQQVDQLTTDWVIDDVTVSPDGQYLAAASGYGRVTIYALPFDPVRTYPVQYDIGSVRQLTFAPDGQSLLINSVYQQNQVAMNDLTTLNPLPLDNLQVEHLTFAADYETVFLATYKEGLVHVDSTTWQRLDSLSDGEDIALVIAPSHNGAYLAVAWDNYEVTLYDWQQEELTAIQSWPNVGFYRVYDLVFSADDSVLMWTMNDQLVRVDLTTMSVMPTVTDHIGFVDDIKASPVGSAWAIAAESTVWLYVDAAATNPILLTGHDSSTTALAFSPDGQLLASADARGNIRLWRVSDGRLLKTVTSPGDVILALAFSPDGAWLVSGGQGRVVRFWGLPADS